MSISGCALSAYEDGPDFLDLMQSCWIIGAEGQNRTADTRLFRPLLYRLSYLGPGCHYKEKRASCQGSVSLCLFFEEGLEDPPWFFHGICSAWKILDLFLLDCVGNQKLSCYSAKDFFLHPKRGAFLSGKLMSGQSVTLI